MMQESKDSSLLLEAMRRRFKLSKAQRAACSLSFMIYLPKVKYVKLRKMAESKQYLILDHAFKQRKLVAKLCFPVMRSSALPIEEASVLISVRTYCGISWAVVAPSFRFVDTGNVRILWDSLEELETNNLCSIEKVCKLVESGAL